MSDSNIKKPLLILGKLILTASVFGWVFKKLGPVGRANLVQSVQTADRGWLLAALGMFFVIYLLGVTRWKLLLRIQGINLTFYRVAWMTAVGFFFNVFLIGATGGDVFKGWYASQSAPDRKPHALLSIAVDRFIGLFGMFALASGSVLLSFQSLMSHPKTKVVIWPVIGVLVGISIAVALTTQRQLITRQSWWPALWARMPFKDVLSRLAESYAQYSKDPLGLFWAFILSLGVHISAVFTAYFIGLALGIDEVGLKEYCVYIPIILAISAVPITVGGLGVRESIFAYFFSIHGTPDSEALALSLLFYAGTICMSIFGGIFYLLGKPAELSAPPKGSAVMDLETGIAK